MILVIDNYDSFTFNLVQALEAAGATVRVVRNDAIDRDGVEALADRRGRRPAGDRDLARTRRPLDGRRVGRDDRDRPRPRDPAARRVPRDAVDGGRVRGVDRPGADARPRRGVGGDARRSRACSRACRRRSWPPATTRWRRSGDAAAGAAGDGDERGRPGRHGHPPRLAAARGRPVPPGVRADARRAAPPRELPAPGGRGRGEPPRRRGRVVRDAGARRGGARPEAAPADPDATKTVAPAGAAR